MTEKTTTIRISYGQWLKVHLRLAALEQNGVKLNCKLDVPRDPREQITCHIYFSDDGVNTMRNVSPTERSQIYEGWISFGTSIIRRGFETADLPNTFMCSPEIKFILYENWGMSGAVVQTVTRTFRRPMTS